MQRVLIADDNSNIQKMVSLALKDAGIEVIAVNNGEAAVRKMPEVSPDLVLADIFMPVRSGYEVCEFIKRDPRFMHTPVILLAGAFDPFDENEAQRVQADGVLKKPFVPPDPLVNMVMGLLSKSANEKLVPVGVAASQSGETHSMEAEIARHLAPVREAAVAEPFTDDPPEEFKMPSEGLSFSDDKTLAFGSLLDAPPLPVEAESVVTAMRDPVLGDPAFWAPAEVQEPPSVDELTEGHSWEEPVASNNEASHVQPPDIDLSLDAPSVDYFADLEEPSPEPVASVSDSAPAFELPAVAKPESDELETKELKMEDLQAEEIAEPPVAEASEPEPLPDWVTSQISESAPAIEHEMTPAVVAEPAPLVTEALAPPVTEEPAAPEVELAVPAHEESKEEVVEPEEEELSVEAVSTAPVEGAAEIEPELVEDVTSPVPAAQELPAVAHLAEAVQAEVTSSPDFASMFAPAKIALEHAVESELNLKAASPAIDMPEVPAPEVASAPAAQESPAAAEPPSPELIEAVVARVVERMQPKMMEMVTREILRPVVEALVRREIEKQ